MPTVSNLREWLMFILTLFIVPALGTLAMLQYNDGNSTAALTQQTKNLAQQVFKLEATLEKMNDAFHRINGDQLSCDFRVKQLQKDLDELREARNAK